MLKLRKIVYSMALLMLAGSLVHFAGAYTIAQGSQITADNNNPSMNPAVMFYRQNNTAWTFWSIQGINGNYDIYYRIMDPNCLQNACLLVFYPAHRLTFGPRDNQFSSATETADGKVWVFFSSDRNSLVSSPKWAVYYKTFNGTAWSQDTPFTTWVGTDVHPSAQATNDGGIWVAWASNMTCPGVGGCISNIHLRRFNGTVWAPIQNVTHSGVDSTPTLSQAANSTVWLSWARITSINGNNVFYKTISPTGVLGPEVQLTSSNSDNQWPSIVNVRNGVSNGAVVAVWASNRNNMTGPSYDLFMKYSLNGGAKWSNDTLLNALRPPPDATEPSATQIGPGRIGIVYSSDQLIPGRPNIFSMTILMADVGLTSISQQQTVIGRGQSLKFNVTMVNNGWESESPRISLYGYLGTNVTLIQTISTNVAYMGTRTVSFAWNTAGWAMGSYLVRAVASNVTGQSNPSDTTITPGANVTITIPGDVNGDRAVNILDLVGVALAFGTRLGGPGYNPNMDLIQDGVINILDLVYVAQRFGTHG